jgi:hypothetical protein
MATVKLAPSVSAVDVGRELQRALPAQVFARGTVLRVRVEKSFSFELLNKLQTTQGVMQVICDVMPPKPPRVTYDRKWNPHLNEGVPPQMPPRLYREAIVTTSARLTPTQLIAVLEQLKIRIMFWIDRNPVVEVVECVETAMTIGDGVILYVTPRSLML